MGKLIDEKAIINRNVESYNNFLNEKGKFLEGSPTFSTYYMQNRDVSTEDIGLGAVVEIIGADSPIRFDKIENVPLYQFDSLELMYESDEDIGTETGEIEGSCILPANTFKPNIDDYFSITYLNKNLLFRVTNITGSNLGKKFFYKLEFSLSPNNIEILEERQIHEHLQMIYDKVGGSKNSPIIQSNLYERLEIIDNLIKELMEYYNEYYYSKAMNCYLYDDIYDNFLHMFLSYHKELSIFSKTFMSNKYIIPLLNVTYSYKMIYNHSLFNYIEEICKTKAIPEEEILMYCSQMEIVDNRGSSVFGRTYHKFNENMWNQTNQSSNIFAQLISYINIKDIGKDCIADIILIFTDKNITLSSICDKITNIIKEELLKQLNYSLEEYILLPCLALLLNELKNRILNETNNFLYERSGKENM